MAQLSVPTTLRTHSVPLPASGASLTLCWLLLLAVVVLCVRNPTLRSALESCCQPVSNRQRCIVESFARIIVLLVLSSSPRRHPVCATSPPRCWFLLACVVGSPPAFACCHVVYHPVRLVSTRCRRRRRNRLVLSKLLRCCQLPSDILVPVRFLGQRFLFNPGQLQSPILHSLHSRERPCRRCVQLPNLVRL